MVSFRIGQKNNQYSDQTSHIIFIKKLNISVVIDEKFSAKCLWMTTVETVMRMITI